jgi:TatA/E family protein of Tat protein translocase
MEGLSPLHLVIVLVIAVLVLGPGKLPEVGAALGKSIREFRKATTEISESVRLEATSTPALDAAPPQAPAPVAAPLPTPGIAPLAGSGPGTPEPSAEAPQPVTPTGTP